MSTTCNKLGIVDPTNMIFGGICSHQFGGYSQQLNSVDIRQLSEKEACDMSSNGFYHWYSADAFTQEQLEVLLNGGTIRHTFGIVDTDAWEFGEVFEIIED